MSSIHSTKPVSLFCPDLAHQHEANRWAQRLDLSMDTALPQSSFSADYPGCVLQFDADGLSLRQLGANAPGPVRVDFVGGAVGHRRQFGGGKGQMIAKAAGVRKQAHWHVLDATAGLGRDAFVLASLGCHVTLIERCVWVAALLEDGLERALASECDEVVAIAMRMTLAAGDSLHLNASCLLPPVDVVMLDPMFPERTKSAAVKKEMALFHHLVGTDSDADALLDVALSMAKYRVVVKRPLKAPHLANRQPAAELRGKRCRYDIYSLRKLP